MSPASGRKKKKSRSWLYSKTNGAPPLKNGVESAQRNGWMERGELLRVEWRETASEMEAGGRTVSAGTGAQHRRRSAGYSSTLPFFFLHSDAEALNEIGKAPHNSVGFTATPPKCS